MDTHTWPDEKEGWRCHFVCFFLINLIPYLGFNWSYLQNKLWFCIWAFLRNNILNVWGVTISWYDQVKFKLGILENVVIVLHGFFFNIYQTNSKFRNRLSINATTNHCFDFSKLILSSKNVFESLGTMYKNTIQGSVLQ